MNKTTNPKIKKILFWLLTAFGGIIIIIALLLGGIKANDYIEVNKLVKAADFQIKSEMYTEAYSTMVLTQSRWTTTKVRKNINTKLDLNKQLTADKENYLKGLENQGGLLGHEQNYQAAKDYYLKVSILYPHYNEVQDSIKECQAKIDEANAQAEKDKQNVATGQKYLKIPNYTHIPADRLNDYDRAITTITSMGGYEINGKLINQSTNGYVYFQQPFSFDYSQADKYLKAIEILKSLGMTLVIF